MIENCTVVKAVNAEVLASHFTIKNPSLTGDRPINLWYYNDLAMLVMKECIAALLSNNNTYFANLSPEAREVTQALEEEFASHFPGDCPLEAALFTRAANNKGKIKIIINELERIIAMHKRRITLTSISELNIAEKLTCRRLEIPGTEYTVFFYGPFQFAFTGEFSITNNNLSFPLNEDCIDSAILEKLSNTEILDFSSVSEFKQYLEFCFPVERDAYLTKMVYLQLSELVLQCDGSDDLEVLSNALYNYRLLLREGYYAKRKAYPELL